METDLLAEKMRQAAEVLEKLAAMGVTSVNIESIKETPPASSADPKPPAVDPKTPTTKPADKAKDPPAIKPGTPETEQGTPAQDGQESIESTITGQRITFKMPKPQERKGETWQMWCTIGFVGVFAVFLVAILVYLFSLRGCTANLPPGSHSFRQTLTTSLETHEVRIPEGK